MPTHDLGPFALDGEQPDMPEPAAPETGDLPAPDGPAAQLSADLAEPASDSAPAAPAPVNLTPVQRRTHSELLEVGAPRPYSPPKLPDQLKDLLRERTGPALERWTESSLFLTKSRAVSMMTCEGKSTYELSTPWRGTIHPATAAGTLVHRAVQIAHTHPGHPVASYVQAAVDASVRSDSSFAEFFEAADLGVQSDLVSQATSRVTLFLDSWPTLIPAWTPRFEEPMQAKIGRLTLSARPDLVLGRPKHDGRRTVLLCDFKTGALSERHEFESLFYALVATLRHGVVPFRSVTYSLGSAEWVSPELSAETLMDTAAKVADLAVAQVEVMTDVRPATLTPGPHCSWCPLSKTCEMSLVREAPAVEASVAAPTGDDW